MSLCGLKYFKVRFRNILKVQVYKHNRQLGQIHKLPTITNNMKSHNAIDFKH